PLAVEALPGWVLAAKLALDIRGTVHVVQALFGRARWLPLPGRGIVMRVVDGGSKSPRPPRHHAGSLTQPERLRRRRVVLEFADARSQGHHQAGSDDDHHPATHDQDGPI